MPAIPRLAEPDRATGRTARRTRNCRGTGTSLPVLAALAACAYAAPGFWEAAAQTAEGATQALGVWTRLTAALVEKSARMAAAFEAFPEMLARLSTQISGGGGTLGLLQVIGLVALIFGGAHALERFVSRRWRRHADALLRIGLRGAGQRLSGLASLAFLGLVDVALFAGIATVAVKATFAAPSLSHNLAVTVGFVILAARIGAIPLRLALMPASPELRLLPVVRSDPERLLRQGIVAVTLLSVAYFGSGFLATAGFPPVFVNAWFLIFGLAVTAWGVRVAWRLSSREPVLSGPSPTSSTDGAAVPLRMGAFIARDRRWTAIALIVGAWILWAINLLLDHRESAFAVLVSALIVLLYPAIDRCCRTIIAWAAVPEDERKPTAAPGAVWPLRFRLILLMLRFGLLTLAAILALEAWGLRVFDMLATPAGQKALHALLTLAVAAPLAMLIWHGSQALLLRKLGRLPTAEDETPGTRAHTLVPILRTFLLVLLFVLVAMMVLVAVGVEIGPLIAGAGIFGVAVGFGSQSLVRDVISGFFFLLDDAFRLGEYIDVGKCKGTVEKISIRSIQLRHHRGALNTIPYGQIQSISNFTRDWVIEKLEFGLVYGTDPEKVRKLVKKIGQEQMANPELSRDILDPLKSQGVQRFADSAIVFRAKVKCRPGRQFTIRREAYRRMQEVFAANGIEFAYPTLNVRGDGHEMQPGPEPVGRP